MQSKHKSVHGYDLHGHLVIDNFTPISFLPPKGVCGKISVLPRACFFSENGFEKINIESWSNEVNVALNDTPSVALLEVVMVEEAFHALQPLDISDLRRLKFKDILKDTKETIINMTENFLEQYERNKVVMKEVNSDDNTKSTSCSKVNKDNSDYTNLKKASSKLTSFLSKHIYGEDKGSIQKLNNQPTALEQNEMSEIIYDESIEESTDDITNTVAKNSRYAFEDIEQVTDFLKGLILHSEPPQHSGRITVWLTCLMTILNELEKMQNLLGLVLIMIVPDGYDSTLLNVSDHLPKDFRRNLHLPTVVYPTTTSNYMSILDLYYSMRIHQATIMPIPVMPGDHVYREMRDRGALKLIQHHGIYTGHGRLIHFSGNEMSLVGLIGKGSHAKVKSVSIVNFMCQGSRLKVRKYKKCDPADVVISRAEEALASQTFAKYHLLKNNCEHFCYYCKTGISKSNQVETGVKIAAFVGAVAVGVTAIALASHRKI